MTCETSATCKTSEATCAPEPTCGTGEPLFFYDFSAPYCYLSAVRIEEILPVKPRWQPIIFGALMGAIGKVSWTLRKGPERDAQMREVEELARQRGVPWKWPRDWPFGTYSTLVVRAAVVAGDQGRMREFSLAAYKAGLGHGGDLSDLDVVLRAAREAGVDPDAVREGVDLLEVKQRVRDITANAVRLGVTGVPAVTFGSQVFWGDDQLEEAARAVAAAPTAAAPTAA